MRSSSGSPSGSRHGNSCARRLSDVGLAEDDRPPARLDIFGAFTRWQHDLIARPGFQKWAGRFPLTRRFVRKDGERIFDLVAGFVYARVLHAIVELELLAQLGSGPKSAGQLTLKAGMPEARMAALCRAAVALGLFAQKRDGRFSLTRLGAAFQGVPGLAEMVRHNDILYRDMADPVGLLRGEIETELAEFWPYVLGARDGARDDLAAQYSDLMAKSQAQVAEETLNTVSFKGAGTVMDVGGGTGAFLRHLGAAYPGLRRILFDLPDVVRDVTDLEALGGSFLEPLPQVADTITLVRVLFDHGDETIEALLRNVFAALPPGGRLVISEPMSGGARPMRATDAYFAFYTMAMRTGQVRSQADIAHKLSRIGFSNVRTPRANLPFITSVVTAVKPN